MANREELPALPQLRTLAHVANYMSPQLNNNGNQPKRMASEISGSVVGGRGESNINTKGTIVFLFSYSYNNTLTVPLLLSHHRLDQDVHEECCVVCSPFSVQKPGARSKAVGSHVSTISC